MKLPDFKVEQWMNDYENEAVYNLTDTCVSPLSFQQLCAMDTNGALSSLTLDYGTITGDSGLKSEILSLYKTGTEDNLTLMHGCLQANEQVMFTLLEKGDRVIVYEPGYQQFSDLPASFDVQVTGLKLYEENGWQPDLHELEEAMKQDVKMIVINRPANPTGVMFSDEYMKTMISLARKQGTWILSDEVYRGLYDEPSVSDLYEKGISTSSLSKVFSLAGLRLGWVKGREDLIHALNVRRDYSIISTGPLSDTLARIALENKDVILKRSRRIIEENKQTVQNFVNDHPGFHIVMPHSGTVGFLGYHADIDDTMLARQLLKDEGVFFVPGSCFGSEKHLRIGFTCKNETMITGLQKLAAYLEKY